MRPDCTRGFGPVGTNGPAPVYDLPALLRDRAKDAGGDKLLEEAAAALEAAREDAERYRWLRDNPEGTAWNEHDHALVGFRIPKRPGTCAFDASPEVLDAAIDQARGKGVAE